MKQLLLTILLLVQVNCFAQADFEPDNFSHKITEATGDLNKDGLPDKVIVTQDTLHENAPYRLQFFLNNQMGSSN